MPNLDELLDDLHYMQEALAEAVMQGAMSRRMTNISPQLLDRINHKMNRCEAMRDAAMQAAAKLRGYDGDEAS